MFFVFTGDIPGVYRVRCRDCGFIPSEGDLRGIRPTIGSGPNSFVDALSDMANRLSEVEDILRKSDPNSLEAKVRKLRGDEA